MATKLSSLRVYFDPDSQQIFFNFGAPVSRVSFDGDQFRELFHRLLDIVEATAPDNFEIKTEVEMGEGENLGKARIFVRPILNSYVVTPETLLHWSECSLKLRKELLALKYAPKNRDASS